MNWTKYSFWILLGISLLSFLPSIGAGFVYDFLGWQKEYEQGTYADILNCFGYKGNHQFLHFVFHSFYEIFHINGVAWYLFFSSLHGINAFLLYRLIVQLGKFWGNTIRPELAFAGAVIFLLHPYSVEAVVWKVCVHYLISMMGTMGILLYFLKYHQGPRNKYLVAAACVYLATLFSLELSFITPLLVSMAGFITWLIRRQKGNLYKSAIFAGVLWGLLGCYLILNKLTIGSFIGHYGAEVHLQFDFLLMVATEMKYLVKHLFFARYYSFETKSLLFDQVLSSRPVAFFLLCILIGCLLLYLIKINRIHAKWHLVVFGFLSSLLFVLTVSNMYFLHLHVGMNDRYSYLPVAMLAISVVALFSNSKKWLTYSVLGLIFLISIFFQQKTIHYWNQSTKVLQALKDDFRWREAPIVFILNSPDNYKGIVMTSIINEPSGIDELIDYQTPEPFNGKMFDVFQFNMTGPNDGVRVEQTGPMQLKVTFNQWGNWWHRNGIGGSSYENEYYKAETLDYPYQITFKKFPPGSIILYQDEMRWKQFDLTPQ